MTKFTSSFIQRVREVVISELPIEAACRSYIPTWHLITADCPRNGHTTLVEAMDQSFNRFLHARSATQLPHVLRQRPCCALCNISLICQSPTAEAFPRPTTRTEEYEDLGQSGHRFVSARALRSPWAGGERTAFDKKITQMEMR